MLLLILLVMTSLSGVVGLDSRPFYFVTTLECNVPEVNEWCAEVYYYDLDSSTEDDPLHYLRLCSNKKNVTVTTGPVEGGGDSFCLFYDTQYIVYHNCSSLVGCPVPNRCFVAKEGETCVCTKFRSYKWMDARKDYTKHKFRIKLNEDSNCLTDDVCQFPAAFKNSNTQDDYGIKFSETACNFGPDKNTVYQWSPQHTRIYPYA